MQIICIHHLSNRFLTTACLPASHKNVCIQVHTLNMGKRGNYMQLFMHCVNAVCTSLLRKRWGNMRRLVALPGLSFSSSSAQIDGLWGSAALQVWQQQRALQGYQLNRDSRVSGSERSTVRGWDGSVWVCVRCYTQKRTFLALHWLRRVSVTCSGCFEACWG